VKRERETREELGYGPWAHSNAHSLLLLLNELIFYLPRTSNGDHIFMYQGRLCTEIRHVSIRLDITSPSIESSFLCPHTTGPTGHLPDRVKAPFPTCDSNRRLYITSLRIERVKIEKRVDVPPKGRSLFCSQEYPR
jgi:hypothetical protein